MNYVVNFTWDPEAGVWIATSNDIPGLVLESESFDSLKRRVIPAASELLALSGRQSSSQSTLTLISDYREKVAL